MEKKYVESERGRTFYWIGGQENADCIVLVHGLSGDHTLFEPQAEYFSASHRVINLDLPLHGDSRPYRDFSYENCAEDISRILANESITRVIMLGQSLGGFACQAFYLKYPSSVRAFVSVDSSPFGNEYTSRLDRFWLRYSGELAYLTPYRYWLKAAPKSSSCTQAGQDSFAKALSRYTKRELCQMYHQAYGDYLSYQSSLPMQCPVLLVLGEHDHVGKVAQYTRMWAERAGYPLAIIKNAAHMSNYDNREEFNRVVDEFIGRL